MWYASEGFLFHAAHIQQGWRESVKVYDHKVFGQSVCCYFDI